MADFNGLNDVERRHEIGPIRYTHEDIVLPEKDIAQAVEQIHLAEELEVDDVYKFTFGGFMALFAIWLPYMADILYISAIGSLLTVINADIGPDVSYAWVATSFAICSASFSPLVGRMGDIFGRRYFILTGNGFSIIGLLVGATAKSINSLIVCSAFVGTGVAMHQLAYAAIPEVVPKKSRGVALGFLEGALGVFAAFASLIGYGFVQSSSWRNLVWLCFAIQAASAVMIFFFYHPMNQYIKEEGRTRLQQFLALDWVGFFIFIVGLTLLLAGISFGGGLFPWLSAGTIAPIVVGFVMLLACIAWEATMPLDYPFFPPVIFRNIRGFTLIQICVFLIGVTYFAGIVLWPAQTAALYANNPIDNGLYNTAPSILGLPAALGMGYILKKTKKLHIWFAITVGIMTLVSGLSAIVTPGTHIASTFLSCLGGSMVAASTCVSTTMVQISVPHEFIGVATAIIALFRSFGGAVGTAVYVSILQNKVISGIPTYVAIPLIQAGVDPTTVGESIEALLAGDVTSPHVTSLTLAQLGVAAMGIKQTYAHALKVVYLVSIAFGAVGVICSLFVADVDHFMTGKIDIKLEEGAHLHNHTDTGEGHIIKHAGLHDEEMGKAENATHLENAANSSDVRAKEEFLH